VATEIFAIEKLHREPWNSSRRVDAGADDLDDMLALDLRTDLRFLLESAFEIRGRREVEMPGRVMLAACGTIRKSELHRLAAIAAEHPSLKAKQQINPFSKQATPSAEIIVDGNVVGALDWDEESDQLIVGADVGREAQVASIAQDVATKLGLKPVGEDDE
jgi:hypothetical protein